MATPGIAVTLYDRAILDLAWRCTDPGGVRTPSGPGRVAWREASREPRPLDLAPMRARLAGRRIGLALRRAF